MTALGSELPAVPARSSAEARAHETFMALLWSLSHPGRPHRFRPGGLGPLEAVSEALLDLETSFFTTSTALGQSLRARGARPAPPGEADYQLHPSLGPAELEAVAQAGVGTMLRPDAAATLVLACDPDGPVSTLRLSGPGVPGQRALRVSGLPAAFWVLRERAVSYPLGWDALLVTPGSGGEASVVGLPRSTAVREVG